MPLADMWRQGELPPPEVQLSRATLLEIKRLKAWADRRQAELFEVQARAAGVRQLLDEHKGAEIFQRRQFHRLSSSVGTLTRPCLPGRLNLQMGLG